MYIGLQYKNKPDLSGIVDNQKLTILEYDVETRPGVVRVRSDISDAMLKDPRFGAGDFFLMIDAHSKFAQNWDIDLINDIKYLQVLKNKKEIILSKQCGNTPGQLNSVSLHETFFFPLEQNVYSFSKPVTLFYGGQRSIDSFDEKFQQGGWASCHFFFTTYDFVKDVGFDKYSNTFQEEPYLSFRSFIAGYDIYANITYNYVAHDSHKQYDGFDPRYWIKLDNGEHLKVFTSKSSGDDQYASLIVLAYINNIGRYSVKNAKRGSKMFFDHFKISDVYDSLINNKDLNELLNDVNQKYTNMNP